MVKSVNVAKGEKSNLVIQPSTEGWEGDITHKAAIGLCRPRESGQGWPVVWVMTCQKVAGKLLLYTQFTHAININWRLGLELGLG
jgi:hypothetical protein